MSGYAALEAALARAEVVADRAEAATRREPVDPAVRAALAAVARTPTTAAEESLGERVRHGLLDWDDVWRDPHASGPGGVRLVQRALVVLAHEVSARGTRG